MHVPQDERPGRAHVLHGLSIEFFGLVELEAEVEQAHGRDGAEAEADAPGCA